MDKYLEFTMRVPIDSEIDFWKNRPYLEDIEDRLYETLVDNAYHNKDFLNPYDIEIVSIVTNK
ncbi:MAG: hypothetical protein WD512_00920 [Candidatus Paceibacterota bacterium]